MEMKARQLFDLIILKIKRITGKKIFRICSVSIIRFYKIWSIFFAAVNIFVLINLHVGVTFVDIVICGWELEPLDIYL